MRPPQESPTVTGTALPCAPGESPLQASCDELERRIRGGEPVRAEEFFARHPALTEDPEQALDLIYVEYATRRELSEAPSQDELVERFPQWRAQLQRQFQLDELLDQPDTRLPKSGAQKSSSDRFRVCELLARGGVGRVMRAIDSDLNREVAVKELQPSLAENDEARERFLREAEITGRLEHPGIVPVYGLGCDAAGRPFYAMRLVRGQSLEQAALEFHQRQGGKHRFLGIEFQSLMRRFLHVCETVAYAHSRGVIHRDLKPSNILLGPFGETLVADWGLARATTSEPSPTTASMDSAVGQDRATPGPPRDSLKTSGAHWSNQLTQAAGELIGTPAFMSPEQAAGQADRVGPASDVYNLGATFYLLLTGQAPFCGSRVDETLKRVTAGAFNRPRELLRAIPLPLEAICLKAMARRPEDRYSSPRELASDLEHWLADEPVRAAREPVLARLARWGRRNRTRVVAGSTALVIITVVSVVAAIRINGERLRADRERIEAERRTARLAFDRGSVLVENHEYGAGMLWFARALQHVPGHDADMRRVILTNLAAARHYLLRRRGSFEHSTSLTAAEFSSDGAQAITADSNGHVRLWDVASHGAGADWEFNGRIHAARIVGEDAAMVAASTDRTISLQSFVAGITSGSEPIVLSPAVDVACAAFSPDGQIFGAGSRGPSSTKARLWRTADGQLLRELDHPRTISQIVFQPKSEAVATVCEDGRVRRWAAADGRLLGEVKLEYGRISRIAFTPDGKQMLLGDSDGSISCWNIESGRRTFDLAKHSGAVTALACTSDGRTVAAAWDTGTIRTWDLENRRPVGELLRLDRHTRMLAFRPGTRQMLVAAERHSAVLWEIPDLAALAPPLNQGQIQCVAFSPDGNSAVTGSANRTVVIRDGATGKQIAKASDHKGSIRQVRFRPPDGAILLTASYDGTARLWNARDGKPHGAPLYHRPRPQDRTQVEAAAFSRDGRFVLTGDSTGTVRAWDGDTGELVRVFDAADKRNGTTTSVCFSQDATRVVAAFSGPDNGVRVWSFAGGEPLWVKRHGRDVRMVAVSPDDRYVVSASNDETARFWDLEDGSQVGHDLRHRGEVFFAGFSRSGKLAATGGYDATVRLWEVPAGRPAGEAMQHEGIVMAGAFSADGTRLLTGSADRSARLWDVATCLPLAPPLMHNDPVLSVDLSPDARTAFTGRVWRLPGVLPDEPPLIELWLQLATGRKFTAGDNMEWLEPAALAAVAGDFQARTGKSWDQWGDISP